MIKSWTPAKNREHFGGIEEEDEQANIMSKAMVFALLCRHR